MSKKSKEPLFYRLLAKALAKPFIRDKLIGWAQDKRYFTLRDLDEEYVYMRRWWLVPKFALEIHRNGSGAYDWYYEPKPWWPFRWRIHQILRADYDRHYHNHPTAYRTFILDGWYEELSPDPNCRFASATVMGDLQFGKIEAFIAGMTAYRPATHWHTIKKVSGEKRLQYEQSILPTDGVWTLFCMSNKDRECWGFLVDGKMVNSVTYFERQWKERT